MWKWATRFFAAGAVSLLFGTPLCGQAVPDLPPIKVIFVLSGGFMSHQPRSDRAMYRELSPIGDELRRRYRIPVIYALTSYSGEMRDIEAAELLFAEWVVRDR